MKFLIGLTPQANFLEIKKTNRHLKFFFKQKIKGKTNKKSFKIFYKSSHLVKRVEVSLSEAVVIKHRSIREVIFRRMIAPLDFWESCFCGSLTLTHLSFFLFPHCKKKSGSIAIDVDVDVDDNLQALSVLSSFSIPTTKKTMKTHKNFSLFIHQVEFLKQTQKMFINEKNNFLANSVVLSANPMYFF